MEKKNLKVLVGVSGGVDSAVCAHILKKKGYDVVGAMMRVYDGNSKTIANSCYGADKTKEINDAKEICKQIGIDFHLIDCSKEFDKCVFETFKNEYKIGRTPNPCTLCNPLIKFGFFPQFARQKGIIFDKFATGHYARIEYDQNTDKYLLKKGVNEKKDQSYFLYALTQEKLEKILFPLGEMEKVDVRRYAKENGLIVANKTDSQDFYDGNYSEIIDARVSSGNIMHVNGEILGTHNGIFNYTIGQRKGLKVAYSEPLYVTGLNPQTNEVIVGEKEHTFSKGLFAKNISLTFKKALKSGMEVNVKIRSRGPVVASKINLVKDGVEVYFNKAQSSVTPGQAVVFYKGDVLLGGATIENALHIL